MTVWLIFAECNVVGPMFRNRNRIPLAHFADEIPCAPDGLLHLGLVPAVILNVAELETERACGVAPPGAVIGLVSRFLAQFAGCGFEAN
jgi:hypothetical protein